MSKKHGKSIREWVESASVTAVSDIFAATEQLMDEYDAERDATISQLQAEIARLREAEPAGYVKFSKLEYVSTWVHDYISISERQTPIYRYPIYFKPPPAPTSIVEPDRLYEIGQRVRKIKGSSWQGRIVGFYSTSLTPIGYCVESEREPGSVQLYPEAALERAALGGSNG